MNEKNKPAETPPPQDKTNKAKRPAEKGKNVQDILQKARRRGIQQKGQQGVIEFDYPRKKE
ncbi:hypothetical protein LQ236_002073 [Nitrospina gracilis]|nr:MULTISPECIES: hypothetical protein [Nitrospina]MCF8724053.1 hypothetical protein [Nitrospina sp. Nb-3]